jgi:hypothetical protein
MMTPNETLLSLSLGIALAAAVGLRVFVPLLVVSVAAHFGQVPLAPSLEWVGSLAAMATFAVAAVAEIAGYYMPGVDHLLDTIAAPLAVVAGTLLVAAPLWELPPLVKWTVAIVAGGGAAGLTQGITSLLRVKSSATTGGLGNPVVATGELGGALVLSLLAVLVPVLALLLAVALAIFVVRRLRRLRRPAADHMA